MKLVVHGATLQCSMGVAPSALAVLPVRLTDGEKLPLATIMDFKPMVNIMPFAMCITPTNPQVAAATAAALGVLTPQPCIPVVTAPWAPGVPHVTVSNEIALSQSSTCQCAWAGVITIVTPQCEHVDAR